jgi:3-hydroxyisobutyrate dehydrogenase-like beta-hydroxyacid dehydrogenase
MTENTTDVTMIGLGDMGSALASAAVGGGHDVTVWNRTSEKAAPLGDRGARIAPSFADAVSASDLIIVCLRGYEASNRLLRDPAVAAGLGGTTVVQLGTGAPTEVTDAALWFADHGVSYLDGFIGGFPRHVGTSQCRVLLSGDAAAFDRALPVLETFGSDVRFIGTEPVAASVIDLSSLAHGYLNAQAFINAAALCEAAGAPIELLAEVVTGYADYTVPLINSFVEMLESRTYDSHELRLEGAADNTKAIYEFGQQVGVNTELFESAHRTLAEAFEAKHGYNIAAVFETLRRTS